MSKYNFEYKENNYKTPPVLYRKALHEMRMDDDKFTLDACCSDTHIPALLYNIKGEVDGLKTAWEPYTWCNPPFNECAKWIKKAYEEVYIEDNCQVVAMLLPVRTETKYWHDYILSNPLCHIQWLKKGYKFLNNKGEEMGVFKNALALVYFYSAPGDIKSAKNIKLKPKHSYKWSI